MDHLVCLNDFLHDCFGFLFIHLPNLANPVVVTFFKPFVLLLKFFEHLSEVLEFFSAFDILSLEFSKLLLVLAFDFSDNVLETSLSESQE